MKKAFCALTDMLYRIGGILLVLGALWIAFLAGSFFLNLFGILSYPPPMNQNAENVVSVDLVDCSGKGCKVLVTLTGEEMKSFLEEFGDLKAKRYANDPPEPYGDIMIALHYADGCIDRIGDKMNDYRDAKGKHLPAGGWYWFPEGTLDILFQEYTAR